MSKTKIDKAFIGKWAEKADTWLAKRGFGRDDVKTGSQAYQIAAYTEMLGELYYSRPETTDHEIQTALKIVFPKAVFKENNRY